MIDANFDDIPCKRRINTRHLFKDENFSRNLTRSRHGIRVLELRESSGGMVVSYRHFPGPRPPSEALVPPYSHSTAALVLVVEDSSGNILKHPLPTAF